MEIRSIVRSYLKSGTPDETLFDDSDSLLIKGVVDSIRMLDLITFLEGHFGLQVEEDELMPENFESVDAITRFVEAHRNEQ